MPPQNRLAKLRNLCRTDLFFLLRWVCNRPDLEHDWILDRIREVEDNPNGYLDLWARGHYKSTIITFGKTLQDILASHGQDPDPIWRGIEPTFGIFSHTRPIAKGFLRQLKREIETNVLLKEWFPDVLFADPEKESPKWSEDDGLIVRRKSNPKESTVEAWGLVDGQPTAKHFSVLIYDDVVTMASVTSPEMAQKTTEMWETSLNLGDMEHGLRRYIGTRWHMNDTYRIMMQRRAAIPRKHAGTEDGTENGKPVLLSEERMAEKRREMGPTVFAAQILLDPRADKMLSLKREWLRFYDNSDGSGMNRYLLVDPASGKKKSSDYTAMVVIGLANDRNYYVLDMLYDRLNLTERSEALFHLHRRWRPSGVGYERYGKDADIEHIEDQMEHKNYHFDITELKGPLEKMDRIKRLIPVLMEHRFYLPKAVHRVNYEGKVTDVVEKFLIEEYDNFPVPVHDDMLDVLSRIFDEDLDAAWPYLPDPPPKERYAADRYKTQNKRSWKSA